MVTSPFSVNIFVFLVTVLPGGFCHGTILFFFFCRNGPVVSGGVNILNPSTAVVNPEHLDGEELLKHIRQIIQSSCIDDNIKVGGKN